MSESLSRLFVAYSHIDESSGLRVHSSTYTQVEGVDPQTHAVQAPEAAEWFSYFTLVPGRGGQRVYKPLEGPLYLIDAELRPWIPAGDNGKPIQESVLRRSHVAFPFYEDPMRNVVVSTS